MSQAVYDMITDRICELLEQGVIPWHKPWRTPAGDNTPRNLVSKKPYRGINVFLLAALGYASPYWLTFNQANSLGGHVRKGAKGAPVIFWKMQERIEGKDQDGRQVVKRVPFLRYYTVFNADQVEGIEGKIPSAGEVQENESSFNPIETAQTIIEAMPNRPDMITGNLAAYYPGRDAVALPAPELFTEEDEYYCVAFHELTHSTGHPSRLNREGITAAAGFGSAVYSKEELVAEMGAAYLCGEAGILPGTITNSAAYIKGWLERLRDKDNRKWLIHAAAQAQKAANYILGRQAQEDQAAAE